jgi:hypothetical protein
MGTTTLDLYRIGDASGPAMENVVVGSHIIIFSSGGQNWVRGTPNGGASTSSRTRRLKAPTSRWWTLPAGSQFSSLLSVRNDHGKHYVWEAASDMPLADYLDALRDINKRFV